MSDLLNDESLQTIINCITDESQQLQIEYYNKKMKKYSEFVIIIAKSDKIENKNLYNKLVIYSTLRQNHSKTQF